MQVLDCCDVGATSTTAVEDFKFYLFVVIEKKNTCRANRVMSGYIVFSVILSTVEGRSDIPKLPPLKVL